MKNPKDATDDSPVQLTPGVYGRLYLQRDSNFDYRLWVLPVDWDRFNPTRTAVVVWTLTDGWIHEGPWQEDIRRLIAKAREDTLRAQQKEKAHVAEILATYPKEGTTCAR